MSIVSETWHVYVLYAVLLAVGVSGFWSPLFQQSPVVRGKAGLMIGIVTAGNRLGSIIFSPLSSAILISTYGWRNAFIIIGIIVFVLIEVPGLFLKGEPKKTASDKKHRGFTPEVPLDGVSLTFRQALGTRQFWMTRFALYPLRLMGRRR